MIKCITLGGCLLLTSLGCGSSDESPQYRLAAPRTKSAAEAPSGSMPSLPGGARDGGENQTRPDDNQDKAEGAIARKIVYKADVRVIVTDFDAAEHQFRELTAGLPGAYIARAEVVGSSGSPRQGHWTVRIPVAQFDPFLSAISKLGVPEKNTIDSSDVTEEYFDLEARMKNKKVEEARLLKHLESSTGKLEEILAVEKELTRVRGEIEQQEGRLRLLANLASLTTVTVTLQEIKNYVPPQTPTFSNSVTATFTSSIDVLVNFGKLIVLLCVALAPWLPPIAAIAASIWLLARRRLRRPHPAVAAPTGQ
jgi:hypothetical protein